MKKRILISPNSFKECADSVTIAELIRGNLSVLNADLIVKPISDGGDGFLRVCQFYFGGELRMYSISTAYDESLLECPALYCKERKHIYIESAEVLGVKVVPTNYRNPLRLSSKGLGELLIKIEEDIQANLIEVNRVFIGIGGTTTIDMGIGVISKLGLTMFDNTNSELTMLPEYFDKVGRIEYKPFKLSFDIHPVVDVNNPLLGVEGGIQIFGKQKGANSAARSVIEKGFGNLLNLFENKGLQFPSNNLSGAGGGIPAVLQIFYNSKLISSNEFICDYLLIRNYLADEPIDYLITGEGAYDSQSGFGKGAGILINMFSTNVNKIFLLCGRMSSETISLLPGSVIPIVIGDYFESESDSILNYKRGIEMACQEIVNHLNF